MKKHGAKYGYARYADLISQGADGRYRVEGDEARKAVLGLKTDPHAASLMAGELASLLLSRMAVPVFYFMVRRREGAARALAAAPLAAAEQGGV